MSKLVNIWAIVPAAGIGQRMGTSKPKQYMDINKKPVLAHTLDTICQLPQISKVVIPLHPEDHYWHELMHLPYNNFVTITGGTARQDSVLNALAYLENKANPQDFILVHDAVRPCVSVANMSELLAQIISHPVGGLWGVPVRDTLKQVDAAGQVMHTVSREHLWQAQTPQIFRFELLYLALKKAKHDNINLTDEASAIEYLGYHPKMVQGSYANIKITWPEDLISASLWFKQLENRACE